MSLQCSTLVVLHNVINEFNWQYSIRGDFSERYDMEKTIYVFIGKIYDYELEIGHFAINLETPLFENIVFEENIKLNEEEKMVLAQFVIDTSEELYRNHISQQTVQTEQTENAES